MLGLNRIRDPPRRHDPFTHLPGQLDFFITIVRTSPRSARTQRRPPDHLLFTTCVARITKGPCRSSHMHHMCHRTRPRKHHFSAMHLDHARNPCARSTCLDLARHIHDQARKHLRGRFQPILVRTRVRARGNHVVKPCEWHHGNVPLHGLVEL
ncbi:hypothetical protein BCR44DRAFT_1452905, partial [Catenaria anguillulae PL171]